MDCCNAITGLQIEFPEVEKISRPNLNLCSTFDRFVICWFSMVPVFSGKKKNYRADQSNRVSFCVLQWR